MRFPERVLKRYCAATLLMPCFKNARQVFPPLKFLDSNGSEKTLNYAYARNAIAELFAAYRARRSVEVTNEEPTQLALPAQQVTVETVGSQESDQSRGEMFDLAPYQSVAVEGDELLHYLTETLCNPRLGMPGDEQGHPEGQLLKYVYDHRLERPMLTEMACEILAAPPSTAGVERDFLKSVATTPSSKESTLQRIRRSRATTSLSTYVRECFRH
eukprot:GHVU01117735.1.p1 GENE.GHVU01117735.1~~GHVU01117735.1.p1  ORF type:complete len:215 (-),score=20.23 GHVU01117735.1:187-831(-)